SHIRARLGRNILADELPLSIQRQPHQKYQSFVFSSQKRPTHPCTGQAMSTIWPRLSDNSRHHHYIQQRNTSGRHLLESEKSADRTWKGRLRSGKYSNGWGYGKKR